MGKVETCRPVVKSWLPAGVVENVIHLKSFSITGVCSIKDIEEILDKAKYYSVLQLNRYLEILPTMSWYLLTTISRPGAPLPWLTKDSRVEFWNEG